MLRVSDIRGGQVDQSAIYRISRQLDAEYSRTKLTGGEVLLSIQGTVDRAAVVPQSLAGANISRTLAMIRLTDPAFGSWVQRVLESPRAQAAMRRVVGGTTRDSLNLRDLRQLVIPLAPESQRRAILDVIDQTESKTRSASAHVSTARHALGRFHQAVLVAACSGRLTLDWREQHLQRSYAAQVPRQAVSPLIEVPEDWPWKPLQDIADLRGGIQKGAKLKPGEPSRVVPYLRVANVQRGWLDLSEIKTIAAPESKIASLTLEPGDILFNEGGDRDKLGRGWIWEGQIQECIHQNHVFRARLRDRSMQPRFYSWFGNSIGASYFIEQGKQTVNLASLSMTP